MPNDAYFQGNPVRLDISRCSFNRKPRWTGSWNTGKLVPIFATSSIMPGDTLSMSVASAIRMTTPVFPVMDDMDITIEAYFVPHRLIMSRQTMSPDVNDSNRSWAAFIGAQDSLLNMPTPSSVELPVMSVDTSWAYKIGGLADCLGYPMPQGTGAQSYAVNCLKILSYYSIWNDYWREPNCQNPVTYTILSNNYLQLSGSDAGVSGNPTRAGDQPLAPVSRYHGYFGSALPWPQRNATTVQLPLGQLAPVRALGADHTNNGDPIDPLHFLIVKSDSTAGLFANNHELVVKGSGGSRDAGYVTSPETATINSQGVGVSNLWADLSQATAASVNQFRLAVQTQRWYEALARGGNKYSDLIASMFSVSNATLKDRAEYLGGFTAPITISQVAVTAGNDTQPTSPTDPKSVGTMGAFSLSNPQGFLFKKSFTEHGTLMVVACCRVRESFCQGIAREDTKRDKFEFYWPQFANLGEQPILEREIYVNGLDANDKSVFGYQEAWAEYRMIPDVCTGYARPNVTGGLGYLTYCNNFATAPTLKGYLDASTQVSNVDNTLQVSSTTAGFQFFGQFQFDCNFVRPMPLYSIPGLVDHH